MRKVSKKTWILMVSILLVLSVTVGGTIAFLSTKSGPVENTFNASKVTTKVNETISGSKKTNVTITNTGDIDAWIRAAVIVTWQDKDGNVYGQAPVAGTNYTDWTPGTDWLKGDDGFYYYTKPVAAGGTTTALINSIEPIGTSPANGYYLTVEILGSGIQAVPANAFNEAWAANSGVTLNSTNADPALWTLSK